MGTRRRLGRRPTAASIKNKKIKNENNLKYLFLAPILFYFFLKHLMASMRRFPDKCELLESVIVSEKISIKNSTEKIGTKKKY